MLSYYESERDNMRLPYTHFTDDAGCLPHFHAGVELLYVIKGEVRAASNGVIYTVHAGEMLVNDCYAVHSYMYSEKEYSSVFTVIPLGVVPSIQKLLTSNRFRSHVIADDDQHSLYTCMRLLAENGDNEIMQKGLSYTILGYLTGRIPLIPVGTSDQADVVCRILNYLSDHFDERLSVEQVASHFGYSRSRFSHLFKNTIGYSLPQYMNMLRCRYVGERLLTEDTSAIDLAFSVGFNNAHTFYTTFKECYHMTPKEYVRRHKQSSAEDTGAVQ